MAAQCFNCGKGIMYGNNVSHAKNRTKRVFKPNLHSARIIVGGVQQRVKLCTKCQRTIKTSNTKHKIQRAEEAVVPVAEVIAPVAAA
jgi:large subunit ribosomal protein L28